MLVMTMSQRRLNVWSAMQLSDFSTPAVSAQDLEVAILKLNPMDDKIYRRANDTLWGKIERQVGHGSSRARAVVIVLVLWCLCCGACVVRVLQRLWTLVLHRLCYGVLVNAHLPIAGLVPRRAEAV